MILSVSIIAKNEATWISSIIKDCKKFADEIVVCDTGSTDKTVEIAEKLGCKITRFTWNNSFADARNAGLAACSGKYVMWVDCDDRIIPTQQLLLRRLKTDYLARYDDRAYLCNMISDDGQTPSYMEQMRIFPKKSDDMWGGQVHEGVLWCFPKWDIKVDHSNIWVYHEGYTDPEMLNAKIKRNVELLESDIVTSNDPVKRSYLAATWGNLGDHDKALEEFAKIYDNPLLQKHKGQRFLMLMRTHASLLHNGEYEALWGAMELAKKCFPDDPQPWGIQAQAAMQRGKVDLARELAVEALKRDYNPEAGLPIILNVHEKMNKLIEATQSYVEEGAYA